MVARLWPPSCSPTRTRKSARPSPWARVASAPASAASRSSASSSSGTTLLLRIVCAPTAASSSPVTAVREPVMRPSASTSTALWCEPKCRKVAAPVSPRRARRPVTSASSPRSRSPASSASSARPDGSVLTPGMNAISPRSGNVDADDAGRELGGPGRRQQVRHLVQAEVRRDHPGADDRVGARAPRARRLREQVGDRRADRRRGAADGRVARAGRHAAGPAHVRAVPQAQPRGRGARVDDRVGCGPPVTRPAARARAPRRPRCPRPGPWGTRTQPSTRPSAGSTSRASPSGFSPIQYSWRTRLGMAAAAWKEATKWIAEPMLTCGVHADAEGVGQDRDAAHLGQAARAADVGLDQVEPADAQVAEHLVAVGDDVVGDRDRQGVRATSA